MSIEYEEPLITYEECPRCGWNQTILAYSSMDENFENLNTFCPKCDWVETGWYVVNQEHPLADDVLEDHSRS